MCKKKNALLWYLATMKILETSIAVNTFLVDFENRKVSCYNSFIAGLFDGEKIDGALSMREGYNGSSCHLLDRSDKIGDARSVYRTDIGIRRGKMPRLRVVVVL